MSHFNDFETEITDEEVLKKALCRCRNRENQLIKDNWIESHEKPTNLYGFQNDKRQQKANIIIRRDYVGGAANDLGFIKGPEGKYIAIISDYDRGYYNKSWMGRLMTYYNIEKTKKEFDAKGVEYTESKDDQGRIQLRAKFKSQASSSRIQVRR
jgi:hypothetical protein